MPSWFRLTISCFPFRCTRVPQVKPSTRSENFQLDEDTESQSGSKTMLTPTPTRPSVDVDEAYAPNCSQPLAHLSNASSRVPQLSLMTTRHSWEHDLYNVHPRPSVTSNRGVQDFNPPNLKDDGKTGSRVLRKLLEVILPMNRAKESDITRFTPVFVFEH
ncbi:hypothetical protein PYCCODRAFT_1430715 [Trametes coccinea BRFM310]|uniref:Uncharacterized protein n=1 Tax=Trametes coccinea (strain BRFM310) TaxID=1353009 RepID=A0A1Y2J233_TRAC3|nr:hypothetical protein PYCCODRAFT_1430715 [Trametes coccinea BRFM310]